VGGFCNSHQDRGRLHQSGSPLSDRTSARCSQQINRFLHVPVDPAELVAKHEMQRELGRRTGTCFQHCVGLDAIGTCHSVTFDIDAKNGSDYQDAPDRCGQFALAYLHANHAHDGGRPRLGRWSGLSESMYRASRTSSAARPTTRASWTAAQWTQATRSSQVRNR